MNKKIFPKSKGQNPALREMKIEARVNQLMVDTKENSKQYTAIVFAAIVAALLKANNRLSDNEIQTIVTKAKKLLLERTTEFVPINEIVRSVLKETDINLSIDELVNVYPEISGYIVPDKDGE